MYIWHSGGGERDEDVLRSEREGRKEKREEGPRGGLAVHR